MSPGKVRPGTVIGRVQTRDLPGLHHLKARPRFSVLTPFRLFVRLRPRLGCPATPVARHHSLRRRPCLHPRSPSGRVLDEGAEARQVYVRSSTVVTFECS